MRNNKYIINNKINRRRYQQHEIKQIKSTTSLFKNNIVATAPNGYFKGKNKLSNMQLSASKGKPQQTDTYDFTKQQELSEVLKN